MRAEIGRYKHLAVIVLGILLLFLYGYQLYHPLEPYFDEVHYVRFIRGLIHQNTYLERSNVHPPLWHLVVMTWIKLFGDYSSVWRMVSLIFGIGLVFLIYPLAKRITGDPAVASLAVFFFIFDCISLTQARAAMMNSFMLFFMMASLLYFLKAFPEGKPFQKGSLRLAGVFFAIALAGKLVALNLLLLLLVVIVKEILKRRDARSVILKEAGIAFFVIPLMIYFAVHLVIPFCKDRAFADIWKISAFHMEYNINMRQTHTYASPWWGWPLMLRPIWFYFKGCDWDTASGTACGILCIGNPAIFWLIPVIIGNLLWEFFKKKSSASGLVLLGFFTQWLSYALVARLQFFHYFYNAMPFVAMGLGLLAIRIWRTGKAGRGIVVAYLIFVAALFVYWYPLLTGLTVSQKFYEHHMWFRKWI